MLGVIKVENLRWHYRWFLNICHWLLRNLITAPNTEIRYSFFHSDLSYMDPQLSYKSSSWLSTVCICIYWCKYIHVIKLIIYIAQINIKIWSNVLLILSIFWYFGRVDDTSDLLRGLEMKDFINLSLLVITLTMSHPQPHPQPIKTCYQIPVLFLYMCIKQWLIKLLQLFQLYTDKSYLYLKHERAHLITSLPVLFMCLIAVPYNMTLVKYYLLFDPGMFPFTSLICLPAKTLNKALPRKENPVPPEFLNQNYVYLLNWNRISYTSV